MVSANECHYAKSPISGDTYERVYFTGETEPRFFANDNISSPFDPTTDYLKLGIPQPEDAPTLSSDGGGATYRAYVYSFVNSYGDEGPPSDVASISDFDTGYVQVNFLSIAGAKTGVDRVYVYRTNSSAAGTAEFQFVLEATQFVETVGYEVGDYVVYNLSIYKCTTQHAAGVWNLIHFTQGENVDSADLLSIFPKTNYDSPPSGLKGLIALPNGSLAGYYGNQLYLSEPGHPHAFPTDYIVAFDEDIVGIGNEKLQITVVTKSHPYIVYGQDPAFMSKEKHSTKLPGLSSRSVVSGGGGVSFMTRQGLIFSGQDGFSNITEKLMKETDIASYNPVTLSLSWFDGKYFAFDSVNDRGFIIDTVTGRFVSISVYAHATYVTNDGFFYLVVDDVALVDEDDPPANMPLCVSKWEGDTSNYLLYTWRSKEFILPKNVNFSVVATILDQQFYGDVEDSLDLAADNAAIFAAGLTGSIGNYAVCSGHEVGGDEMTSIGDLSISSTVAFKFYVNGTLFKDKNLSSIENTFRLPADKTYKRCYFEFIGYVPVKQITIATSVDEL